MRHGVRAVSVNAPLRSLMISTSIVSTILRSRGTHRGGVIRMRGVLQLELNRRGNSPGFGGFTRGLSRLHRQVRRGLVDDVSFLGRLLTLTGSLLRRRGGGSRSRSGETGTHTTLASLFRDVGARRAPVVIRRIMGSVSGRIIGVMHRFGSTFRDIATHERVGGGLHTVL